MSWLFYVLAGALSLICLSAVLWPLRSTLTTGRSKLYAALFVLIFMAISWGSYFTIGAPSMVQ